jgi:AcrR family transcriptional regulator
MSARDGEWRVTGVRAIAPLYKRLPKGPHGFAPEEVVHHQRIRMHGAMIEAVAEHGYERMSVKHVIGLAGVSRRAFYEQFANKEDCFMETFDLIVTRAIRRVTAACRAEDGPLESRLRAGLRAFVEEIQMNSKAMRLVAIDALTAGPDGLLRQRRALARSEQLVATSFASPPTGNELPSPLVRAIVGGLHRATLMHLSETDRLNESQSVLTGEMLRWMLLFASPAIESLGLSATPQRPLSRVARFRSMPAADDRERLLESIVKLALREPFEELSAPHIAKEAGLPIDTFLELFESPRECFVAALDIIGGELLEAVADPALVSAEWPLAVCQAVGRLTAHLAGNPASAVMLAAKTTAAGLAVVEDMVLLADEVATLLTEGAPRRARTRLAPKLISGALAYTLHTEVMAGRTHLFRGLTDHLSYVVLAPYLGPERAAQTVAEAATAAPLVDVADDEDAVEARDAAYAAQPPAHAKPATATQTLSTNAPLPRSAAEHIARARSEHAAPTGKAQRAPSAADAPLSGNAGHTAQPPNVASTAQARLAAPVRALGEVREHNAGEQRDDDHDDQRDLAGAEDPTDLDLAEIEDREQSDEHRERHPPSGARQLSL